MTLTNVLCGSPRIHLPAANNYSNLLAKRTGKSGTKELFDVLLGVRGEHGLANLFGRTALTSCLLNQQKPINPKLPLHDFFTRGRFIDAKTKWDVNDGNLSSHNDPQVVYVFLHLYDTRAITDKVDLVFAVEGWIEGGELERDPLLRAEFHCPPDKLHDISELL